MFDATVDKLREAGAIVHDADFSKLDRSAWDTINTIMLSEATAIYAELVERYPDRTSDRLKEFVTTGLTRSAYDYLIAKKQQEILRADFAAQMPEYDAVLTLPAFGEAPLGLSYTGDADYCAPWTLLGAPRCRCPRASGKMDCRWACRWWARIARISRRAIAKWVEQALACDIRRPGLSVS